MANDFPKSNDPRATDISAGYPWRISPRAGFSDPSQFSRHFKRLVGVTPGQFRTPSRIA
jgi:methylphosphotriester-DNA--protein-cysteine methyltransferase